MATSTKTLTPTNQTITIPDMTERPNVSLLTDGIGKEADAINALNSKIAHIEGFDYGTISALQNALLTFMNAMADNDQAKIWVKGISDLGMAAGSWYQGTAYRNSISSGMNGEIVLFHYTGQMVIASIRNGSFSWSSPTNDTFNKAPKNLTFTGDFNNTSLIGCYFCQGSSASHAPSSDSNYYAVVCFGIVQIAFTHSANGTTKIWERHYINDRWYDWKGVSFS